MLSKKEKSEVSRNNEYYPNFHRWKFIMKCKYPHMNAMLHFMGRMGQNGFWDPIEIWLEIKVWNYGKLLVAYLFILNQIVLIRKIETKQIMISHIAKDMLRYPKVQFKFFRCYFLWYIRVVSGMSRKHKKCCNDSKTCCHIRGIVVVQNATFQGNGTPNPQNVYIYTGQDTVHYILNTTLDHNGFNGVLVT